MVPGRRLSSWSFPLPPRRAPRSRPPVVDARTSGYPVGTGLQTHLITAALVDSDDAVEVQVPIEGGRAALALDVKVILAPPCIFH